MTEAYVTLSTNDRYAIGALVLAYSLRNVKTTKQLCILITPDVSEELRTQLSNVYNNVVTVNVLDSNDSAHLELLKRPELGVTFTKLHCWTLTQYTKCVFLDADILAVQNADDLFEHPELSASCDIGWPDCFNSGMFVFSPSQDTYSRLLQHAGSTGSFDGGDQGLLNTFFTNWNRLSFAYNMVASVCYTYLPAYKQYGKDVKFVHFLGATKPWDQTYFRGSVTSRPGQEHITSHLNTWWRIFTNQVKPSLPATVFVSPAHTTTDDSSSEPLPSQSSQDNTNISHTEHSTTPFTNDNNCKVIHSPEPSTITLSLPEDNDKGCSHFSPPENCITSPVLSSEASIEQTPYPVALQATSNSHIDPPVSNNEPRMSHSEPTKSIQSVPISTQTVANVVSVPVSVPLSQTPHVASSPVIVSYKTQTQCVAPHPTSQKVPHPRPSVGHRPGNAGLSRKLVPSFVFGHPFQPFQPLTNYRVRSPFSSSPRATQLNSPKVLGSRRICHNMADVGEKRFIMSKTIFNHVENLVGLNMASPDDSSSSSEECKRRWDEGVPDYMGEDSFENIQAFIDSKIE